MYKDKGFEIVAIHTPEFAFEKDAQHVRDAVKRFCLPYPVGLDNNYQTWQAYNNQYWPSHYLINQEGRIVEHNFGEGNYTQTENSIRNLLGLAPLTQQEPSVSLHKTSPETYLGCARANNYHPDIMLQTDSSITYTYQKPLQYNQVGLTGPWLAKSDCIIAQSNTCSLDLNFIATNVYLVMESPTPQAITIFLDGKPVEKNYYSTDMNNKGEIIVNEPRMYEIINLKEMHGNHIITVHFKKNIAAYVFTFG
jgi:hypothetical protein